MLSGQIKTHRHKRGQSDGKQAARKRRYWPLDALTQNRDGRPKGSIVLQPIGGEDAQRQLLALRLYDAAKIARDENLIGHANDVHEDEQKVGELFDGIELWTEKSDVSSRV